MSFSLQVRQTITTGPRMHIHTERHSHHAYHKAGRVRYTSDVHSYRSHLFQCRPNCRQPKLHHHPTQEHASALRMRLLVMESQSQPANHIHQWKRRKSCEREATRERSRRQDSRS